MHLLKTNFLASLLLTTNLLAIENAKIFGYAKLFYSTNDMGKGLFDKGSSTGQTQLGIGLSADLSDGVRSVAHLSVLSTLGLEDQVVSGVWEKTSYKDDLYWIDALYLSSKIGNNEPKAGCMELNTPLVFSEKWPIATNTFSSTVAINKDLKNTTLIASGIGQSNGANENNERRFVINDVNALTNTNFEQFHKDVYGFGIQNNSYSPLNIKIFTGTTG